MADTAAAADSGAAGPPPARAFKFAIDRGGSFTDVFAECPDGRGGIKYRVMKLLSVDPANYPDAPREGIRRILEQETGIPHPRGAPLDTSRIASIRMGTTLETNALLERAGERCALAITAGFSDLLHIGNQARPSIFDLAVRCPGVLHEAVVEVEESVVLPLGDVPGGRAGADPVSDAAAYAPAGTDAVAVTGEAVRVEKAPDLDRVATDLRRLLDAGFRSLAVVFKHAATFPDHERAVGALARQLGFTQVSLSSDVSPVVKMVPRGFTATADAYLTPHIARYIAAFQSGFDAGLVGGGGGDGDGGGGGGGETSPSSSSSSSSGRLAFMQSDGALAPVSAFSGHRAILSGPAGGYVGYARTTRWGADAGSGGTDGNGGGGGGTGGGGTGGNHASPVVVPPQIIGFDMGGTSTDVSRFAGAFEHVHECTTAGVTIQAPQLDINTVAAGGGSRLFYRHGLVEVGPESAGAHPGPLCYRKGGHAAVTDANLVLGRIVPAFFPSIFGPGEDAPLDAAAAEAGLRALAEEVNADARAAGQPEKTVDEVAMGFIRVANEAMCRPIRALTQMKGHDTAAHTLAVFGGAGGQHACAVARALGMRTVFIHAHAGILSAVGIALADVAVDVREPVALHLGDPGAGGALAARLAGLEARARADLAAQGFADAGAVTATRFLNLRYDGTDVGVMTPLEGDGDGGSGVNTAAALASFEGAYRREFGFVLTGRGVAVDDVRVRAVGPGARPPDPPVGEDGAGGPPPPLPPPAATVSSYFEDGGRRATSVFRLGDLAPGHSLPGPALIIADTSTIVVEPGADAVVTPERNIRLDLSVEKKGMEDGGGADVTDHLARLLSSPPDPVTLSLFGHRFMGIAEQMGRTLQRTSVSVNIKERLDFSCALFGPDGSLVANAPHLPVHLGAMADAVRYQVRHWSPGGPGGSTGGLRPGDVLASNHPQLAGGSHLPDITVITPVFDGEGPGAEIVFFVASRGHHADVGGITPGSMPPASTALAQEGAALLSFKLVDGVSGEFDEAGISAALLAPAALADVYPGCSGTRTLSDNLSDLRAQVAANQRGIALVKALIAEHGRPVVSAYMHHIQAAAEAAVRAMLRRFSQRAGLPEVGTVTAADQMDDGSPIALAVTIDRRDGSATFDFSGTGPQVLGNTNAPPAVTASAVIYALRAMVDADIPLNQGCLSPVKIIIPPGCLLSPDPEAAVVGGNVLTSQRVTDVVLKAFGAAAASQGCMNNLTFGDGGSGYYETIAGGAGAGPTWVGRGGVHTHMTNTRITDPEVLERRYPVILRGFHLRAGSGGAGKHAGGDGVVRELEFLRPQTVSILSERRATRPFGLAGGGPGAAGVNLLIRRAGGRTVSLGGKATVVVAGGDRLRILTPGGGGWGKEEEGEGGGGGGGGGNVAAAAAVRAAGSVHAFRAAQESA